MPGTQRVISQTACVGANLSQPDMHQGARKAQERTQSQVSRAGAIGCPAGPYCTAFSTRRQADGSRFWTRRLIAKLALRQMEPQDDPGALVYAGNQMGTRKK
jgi:hypothetical protein